MSTAQINRHAVAEVEQLRLEARGQPQLADAVVAVKRFQARRFACSYADLLASDEYGPAARFFLEELYSDRDYAQRDAQFARIASAVETLFPRDVAATASALARLHALTESLDHAMARVPGLATPADVAGYVRAWQVVQRRDDRSAQLEAVIGIGAEMIRLTRTPGLRLMLRMMRGPASAAGLSALQRFLEAGFDTFSAVSRTRGGAERFLALIRERETALMALLFDAPAAQAETELTRVLSGKT
jgi:hypothetical protein